MPKEYVPLRVKSCYSLLSGLTKPELIPNRIESIGIGTCAMTDDSSVSGIIQYLKAVKNKGIKPIIGATFNTCVQSPSIKTNENRDLSNNLILAKNNQGWTDLIKMISLANSNDQIYYKPRLSADQIKGFGQRKNTILISGAIGTKIGDMITDGISIHSDWEKVYSVVESYKEAFKDNFYLETQLFNKAKLPIQVELSNCIRKIAHDLKIKCVATPDAYYMDKSGALDQRILICSNMGMTLKQGHASNDIHFHSAQFYIPTYEEMIGFGHTEEELENTVLIGSSIEEYTNVLSKPILPKFECPDGMSEKDYLRELCRQGWREKIENRVDKSQHQTYTDRVKRELGVLENAELSAYFLILSDILRYVRKNNWLPGPGRGSSAGCLVSYLVGITEIDPIKHDLIFERFYNAARKGSMPDIDIDVPTYSREYIIDYLKDKYGKNRIGQIATFHSIKGRGALKSVFRAHGGISFDEMNEITESLIEENKIQDELQLLKDEGENASLIQWCLENTPNKLKKWAYLDGDRIQGPLADRFEQAMRLEGVKTVLSRHAAGVIIAPKPLDEMFPIVQTKSDGNVVAFEMGDTESAGGIKLDLLGLSFLDKQMGIQQDLLYGEIHEIQRPTN